MIHNSIISAQHLHCFILGFRTAANSCIDDITSTGSGQCTNVQTTMMALSVAPVPQHAVPDTISSPLSSPETSSSIVTDYKVVRNTEDACEVRAADCPEVVTQRTQCGDVQVEGEITNTTEETEQDIHPTTKTVPLYELSGRRIVDVGYFVQKLKECSDHGPFGCTLKNMDFVSEKRHGQISVFTVQCNMCNFKTHIQTDCPNNTHMDINTGTVTGIMCIGAGHRQLEELTAAMDMPAMSANTYSKYHDIVSAGWESTALEQMEISAKKEAQIAVEKGEVDKNGVPVLKVYADGAYGKRSYKNSNYSSLSGVAAIVGYYTKEVLFISVRNRYCAICKHAERNGKEVKSHSCYMNWTGSAGSMESDIIAEGFRSSMDMYGVKYGTLIADGDCSVYNTILKSRPYADLTVEKIECRNHVLRNYGNKMKDIATNSKLQYINLRKLLASNIVRLRIAVVCAARYWKALPNISELERVNGFISDVVNAPKHIFGDHSKCRKYFCKPSEKEQNMIPALKESGILSAIEDVQKHCILRNAKSLLKDVDSNSVEQFNNVVAKVVGGKRINFSLKRSYRARSHAAVVAFNTKTPLYKLHKSMYKTSPGKFTKAVEVRRFLRNKKRGSKKGSKKIKSRVNQTGRALANKDYGPHAQKPDMTPEEFELAQNTFLATLPSSEDERIDLQKGTLLQRDSNRWKDERRKLLTASNFGTVCRRKPHTSCQKLVSSLLYGDFDTDAMIWGRDNEKNAIKTLENVCNVQVEPCGLFVDSEIPFLGATPDGVVGHDGIVEVKCPSSGVTPTVLTPEELILKRKVTFWKLGKEKGIVGDVNTIHPYYYQVQGQLHVTRRSYCLFCVWTPLGIKVAKIERDDNFWEENMKNKLIQFYMTCMLPELVDSRQSRSMPIRDPEHIISAMKVFSERKKLASKKEDGNKCAKVCKRKSENQNTSTTSNTKKSRRKLIV